MRKNVIVTGATGFVGRYLVKELLQNQYSVYAIVRNANALKECSHLQGLYIIETDLEHFSEEDLPKCQYEAFFHLGWAGVNRDEINAPLIHKRSFELSMKCLAIASDVGCRCFISTGSKAEYGARCDTQSEDAECCPDSAYGKEKLHFYQEAVSYCKQVGMRYYHARLFSVIGVDDHPWSLISTACNKFVRNEEMQLGPCTQKWNFTAVEDVVRGLRLLCEYAGEQEAEDNAIYNIAGKDTRVLKEFVEEIHALCNSKSVIFYASEGNAGGCMNPTTDKIRHITGWEEELGFEESIRRILKNHRFE